MLALVEWLFTTSTICIAQRKLLARRSANDGVVCAIFALLLHDTSTLRSRCHRSSFVFQYKRDNTAFLLRIHRYSSEIMSSSPPEQAQAEEHYAVLEILNACSHYQVLDVPITVESAALRRAYLTKSVQVHPDKCNHPKATEAFQRVAEAWTVLSNDETRAEYDARGMKASSDADGQHTAYTPPPPPSFQDALFAFAAATSMMGGRSSAAGSMAQTVFWAEKLVQGRSESTTQRTAHASMALGSGLRAVATGARMMGFKNASVVADRTASLAQTVGVGAMAADANPAVKQALEKGGEKAKELSESINRSLKQKNVRLGGASN